MDPINNTPNQQPMAPMSSPEPRNKGLFATLIIVIVLLALGAIIIYAYTTMKDTDSDDMYMNNTEDTNYTNSNNTTPATTSNPTDDAQEFNSIEAEVKALDQAELE